MNSGRLRDSFSTCIWTAWKRRTTLCVERDGVFREAIEGINVAKAAGFLVTSNTTIYKETDIEEIGELFAYLQTLGVDGHMVSPAYSYAAVQTKDIFMSREEIHHKFQRAAELLGPLQHHDFAALSRISARRTRTGMYRLGHAYLTTRADGRAPAT